MTLLAFLRLLETHLPRLILRAALAWLAGYAALHALTAADTDPRDIPPPLL